MLLFVVIVNAALGAFVGALIWGATHTGVGNLDALWCAVVAGAFVPIALLAVALSVIGLFSDAWNRQHDA